MNPLFRKLNLADPKALLVLRAPDFFTKQLEALASVRIIRRATPKTKADSAIGFAITEAERDSLSEKLAAATTGDAVVWLAYPKRSSKNYQCEFTRDGDWSVFGEAGFEPVRQVALDEDWSALRFRRAEFIKSLKRSSNMAISAQGKRRTGGSS